MSWWSKTGSGRCVVGGVASAEVFTARNGHSSLSARLDEMEAGIDWFATLEEEIEAARGAFLDLNTRLTAIDNANTTQDGTITTILTEINNARGGQTDLDTRLDSMTTSIGTKASRSNNLSDLADIPTARSNLGLTPTAWTGVSFGPGWTNFDTTNYQAVQYRKQWNGRVDLRGLAARTSGTGTTIATLPAGFRPARRLIFTSWDSATICRIDVLTDGIITYTAAGGAASFVSLDGISFDAA